MASSAQPLRKFKGQCEDKLKQMHAIQRLSIFKPAWIARDFVVDPSTIVKDGDSRMERMMKSN